MSPNQSQKLSLKPKTALSLQYFLYFGALGIFLVYFNLYCYHLGFSASEIGHLSATRNLALVLFPLLWSFGADYLQLRRPIYIACCLISTSIWAAFFFTETFIPLLILCFVHGIFYAPLISFLESFTMDALGPDRNNYGRIRVWGSINFILMVVLVGFLIDFYPTKLIITMIFIVSLIQAILSYSVPEIRVKKKSAIAQGIKILLRLPVAIFLCSAFLMLVSHGAYYGFFSIHLENLGFSKTFIGITSALAPIAEIFVMIYSAKLFHRFLVNRILLFAFAVATLRWLLLSLVTSGPLIILTQLLHAVTYGAFHIASILYIDEMIPAESKTIGQAINNAVTYGLGLMIGFELSGRIYEQMGAPAMFLSSSVAALAGGVLLLGSQWIQRHRISIKKKDDKADPKSFS